VYFASKILYRPFLTEFVCLFVRSLDRSFTVYSNAIVILLRTEKRNIHSKAYGNNDIFFLVVIPVRRGR